MGRTVYLAVITGRNDVTNTAVTVRASSIPYHGGTSIYRARITGLDIQYEMEAGLLTARENTAAIDIVNQDALVDSWLDYRFVSVTIRKGDVDKSFSDTNFPKIFEGPIHDVQASINSINIIVADKLQNLNKVIDQSDLKGTVFSGAGNPGSVCRGFLTFSDGVGYSTGIAAADLDKASFDAIDRTYPYPLRIEAEAFDVSLNFLDVVDAALNGLPVSLQVSSRGQFYLARFREPANVSFPRFDAEAVISIDRIWPIGELRANFFEVGDDYRQLDRPTRIHQDIKTLYPQNWRSASIGPIYLSQNNANNRARSVDTMSDAFMKVFDRPYDRIRISTRKDVSNIRLGSSASFHLPRLGHRNGVAVLVTAINERLDGFHEIEGWAPSKLGAGNGRVSQGAERTNPDDDQAVTKPGTPGTPVPSEVSSTSMTWTWAESTGVVARYDIRWRVLNGAWIAWSNNGLSNTFFLGNLTANTTYQFQVRAVNSIGDSNIAFGAQRTNNVAATPQIVLSKTTLNIAEGGSGTFTARLSAAGTKTVSFSSNNSDVTLSPTSASFTAANFSTAITITVSAAEDVDTVNDTAIITATSSGLTDKTIAVSVADDDTGTTDPPPRPDPPDPNATYVRFSDLENDPTTPTNSANAGPIWRFEYRDKDDSQKNHGPDGSITINFNVAVESPSDLPSDRPPRVQYYDFNSNGFRNIGAGIPGKHVVPSTATAAGGQQFRSDRLKVRAGNPARRSRSGHTGPAISNITITLLPGDDYEIGTVSQITTYTQGTFS